MEKLTKAEEEVMQILWRLERATVSQLIEQMDEPKPPHSTISSIIRILERKEIVGHKAYGRTYEYFPQVSKDDYMSLSLSTLVKQYFDGSANRLVSFLAGRGDLSIKDIEELRQMIDGKKDK